MGEVVLKYEYYFCASSKQELLEYLQAQSIPFRVGPVGNRSWVVFKLYSTKAGTKEQLIELERSMGETPIVSPIFTKKELENAELLVLSPKKQWISVINDEKSCRYTCPIGRHKFQHEEQIGLYQISKEPKTDGKTAFWHEDTGWADVFADFRVKKLAKDNGLVGVEFRDVLLRGDCVSQNIFQLSSPNKIPQDAIYLGYGEQPYFCPVCGRVQYVMQKPNIYQLHLDSSRLQCKSDLYVTERIWGEGLASPMYVISQRFYRLLRENKLDGYLSLSPVINLNSEGLS